MKSEEVRGGVRRRRDVAWQFATAQRCGVAVCDGAEVWRGARGVYIVGTGVLDGP